MTDITDEQIAAWEAQDDYDYQLISRINKLEQLCRDLHRGLVYALICAEVPLEGNSTYQDMKQRMDELGLLGLLEGEQND